MEMYSTLRMQRLGSIVFIQPISGENELAGPALTCDLETGTLALAQIPRVEASAVPVYGILGMAKLDAGPALVVITGIEQAAVLRGQPLFKITATQVLTDSQNGRWTAEDRKFLSLLKSGVDPKQYGSSLYFSRAGDATLMQQRWEVEAAAPEYATTPAWKRAEPAYFWNHTLAAPLLESNMEKFVPVAFMGFAGSLGPIELDTPSGPHSISVTLIARRSCRRVGCRQWRRGADLEADVANFVESEQIVHLDDGDVTTSFVQVRGSIPILWSQSPTLQYKIPIRLASVETSAPILAEHIKHLEKFYGPVTAINLANQTGREGKLSATYRSAADAIKTEVPDFTLLAFDFHKHCGATNYKNLELLWNDLAQNFETNGYWSTNSNSGDGSLQRGVFRTNCVDTLDRTNVVQGFLARRQLEHLLRRAGWLAKDTPMATAFGKLEVAFRVLWADHGDEISRQYAGTGAMKSAFTRTGKRDLAGLLDDGTKSLTRYLLNNFKDGAKQDALDLITGAYKIDHAKPVKFEAQTTAIGPVLLILICICFAVHNAMTILQNGGTSDVFGVMLNVGSLVVLAAVMLVYVVRNGQRLVNRPELRPDLTHPWGTGTSGKYSTTKRE